MKKILKGPILMDAGDGPWGPPDMYSPLFRHGG